MILEWMRFAIAAVLAILGLCSFGAAVLGAYRFGFVLNRMHAAGIGDTAGIFLMIASLAVARGLHMDTLKLIVLVFFLWFTSPVSTHFLGQVEFYTNPLLSRRKETAMVLTKIAEIILLILLVVCAVGVNFGKSLLQAVIIFMSYSSIMCILWVLLESPDLAITEAAVGAGVSSVLFMLTLRRIHTEDLRLEALQQEAGESDPSQSAEASQNESSSETGITGE